MSTLSSVKNLKQREEFPNALIIIRASFNKLTPHSRKVQGLQENNENSSVILKMWEYLDRACVSVRHRKWLIGILGTTPALGHYREIEWIEKFYVSLNKIQRLFIQSITQFN